jgi:hypothetical protein
MIKRCLLVSLLATVVVASLSGCRARVDDGGTTVEPARVRVETP